MGSILGSILGVLSFMIGALINSSDVILMPFSSSNFFIYSVVYSPKSPGLSFLRSKVDIPFKSRSVFSGSS